MGFWLHRSFLASLRTRLMLLVLVAVVPVLWLILYTASAQRRSAAIETQYNLLRLAKFAAANQEQAHEGARQLLIALSQIPEVRNATVEECNQLLTDLLQRYRAYLGFGVLDAKGNRICGAPAVNQPINAGDRAYFRLARDTRDFAIGEYQIGRATKKASINFGYPVLDEAGQVKAVVFAALDLSWLNKMAAKAQLPEGSTLTVVDRKDTILVRYPEPHNWIGKPLPITKIIQLVLKQPEGMTEAQGLDGVERLYAFTAVTSASVSPDMFVIISIPKTVAFAQAELLLSRNLASLGFVTILALVAAWVGGDIFLIRKVKSLVKTTKRLRQGELNARTRLANELGELGELARAFDEMAESLETREQEIAKLNRDLQHRLGELQTLFDVIPIGILIARDLNFSEIQANPAFTKILGLPPNTNVSSTPPEGIPRPAYKILCNGKELTGNELPIRYAAIHGVTVEGVVVDAVNEDGVVSNLFGYAAPLFDESGKTTRGAVAAFLDITQLQETQEALRVNRERLDLVLEAAELGLWYCDLPFNNLIWNDKCKEHFGLPPQSEVTIDTFYQQLHPDDRERTRTAIELSIQQHLAYDIDYRTVSATGQIRWIRAIGRAFYDSEGKPIRFDGITVDISERKQGEQEKERLLERERASREEAERANRIKDEFLAILSHELRSPLNPILGWTQLLRSRKLDEQTTTRALATIERNAKLQTQLIEDLLDVSRILRGKLVLNITLLNLASVIEAALETVRLAAEAKDIQIKTILNSNVGKVSGDSGRLQQVVWNLLNNAVKFTPMGGSIEVSLEEVESYAQIQVKDTGKGIKSEFLPYLFEYFRQEDSKTTRKFGGLGLGLAIVRHLTELHGGIVFADSLGEGLGATFTVRLPLFKGSQEEDTVRRRHGEEESETSLTSLYTDSPLLGLRILVVDDEADMRELVCAVLEQAGAAVKVTASAAEALLALEQFKPEVLVSDIGMPNIDGYMLIRQIRSRLPEQSSHIPAVALTAYAGEINQQQAIAAGFQRHLSKPVEPAELIQTIATLVQR